VEVVVARQRPIQVPLAQVEEQALHEQVDELIEQPGLEGFVTAHELERGQDVVLLDGDAVLKSLDCIHGTLVPRGRPDLLPAAQGYDA
jgi:hypothetical protein